MLHRTIRDVMTQDVVTARPETTFKEIIELLHRNDITAVPVVDENGRPVGVVSEADLIRSEADKPEGLHRAALRLRPHDRTRAHAETAQGLMTSPAITAQPEWSIVKAARVMNHQKLKRFPVVDETGRLIGIVSRVDLLSPFLRKDDEIAAEIVGDVLGETLWLSPDLVRVAVDDGVVTLTGKVEQKSLIPIVERLCVSVDGVVAIHQNLDFTFDDTTSKQGRQAERS